MTQAFNLSQLANKVNTSGQLDGATGLTGTITSSALSITGNSNLATSSGSVGIGTASPAQLLEVKKDQAASTRIKVTNKTSSGSATAGLLFENSTSDVAQVQLWDSGTIGALTAFGLNMEGTGTGGVNLAASNGSGVIRFATGGTTERMRIDSSGNVLIGTTSQLSFGRFCVSVVPGVNDGITTKPTTNTTYLANAFLNSSGTTVGSISVTSSATSYITSSDYRLKENIVPMTGALDKVSKLKPVTYNWKVDGSDGQGFIAHELAEVVPDCVTGEKDAVDEEGNPKYQGVDTSFLVATLTAAIQEQQTIINDLKARIEILELK
jgi:hypothetical protein